MKYKIFHDPYNTPPLLYSAFPLLMPRRTKSRISKLNTAMEMRGAYCPKNGSEIVCSQWSSLL